LGIIYLPNLVYIDALEFCRDFTKYEWEQDNSFDFSQVSTCHPFPMLIVGSSIRQARTLHSELKCNAANCFNTYAETMRFYKFIGIDRGKSMDMIYGNDVYRPISDLNIQSYIEKSRVNKKPLGEVLTQRARELARILAQGNENVLDILTFCMREIIRNIPEHSMTQKGYYCAQYWPTTKIVEVSILDEGSGVFYSLSDNLHYKSKILTNIDALEFALKPGVSRTYSPDMDEEIFANEGQRWKNSGYGLHIVSRICAYSGGSFILASGSDAIYVDKDKRSDEIYQSNYKTMVKGTAIQMRLNIDELKHYTNIINRINSEIISSDIDGFKVTSRASSLPV
jgi:hypothetical protein